MQTAISLVKDDTTSLQLQVALLNLYTQINISNKNLAAGQPPLFEEEMKNIDRLLHADLIEPVTLSEKDQWTVIRYEKRLRPLWVKDCKWHNWETCTFDQYRAIYSLPRKNGKIIDGNWELDVRQLFVNTKENP